MSITRMKKRNGTVLAELQALCKAGTEKCARCGETRMLTVDHIVPVHILEQFAMDRIDMLYNFAENFEILCRYCNYQKASRIDVKNPKTYSILAHVLQKARDFYIKKEGETMEDLWNRTP